MDLICEIVGLELGWWWWAKSVQSPKTSRIAAPPGTAADVLLDLVMHGVSQIQMACAVDVWDGPSATMPS